MKKLGPLLILFSVVPWFAVLSVPLWALTLSQKAILVPILIVVGEVLFWIGILLVGKTAAEHYRQWFNPKRVWLRLKKRFR
jgi:hypothetical protein